MAEDDVIKGLVELQVLRVRSDKVKVGIILLRHCHEPFADLHADAIRRLDRSQQMPGLAANLQHAL